VRSLARSLLGLAATADDDARRQRIARAADERALAAEQRLFLHDLLEVAPPSDLRALAAAMGTAAREGGSVDALCALATSAAANAPLFVAIEDIHWADPWTLERLAALAVLAARQPLVLVMTTRFAGDPTAGAWRTALHGAPLLGIDLAPLGEDDSLHPCPRSSLPPGVVASCVALKATPLLRSALPDVGGRRARAARPIRALIHTRMDRLAAADKAARGRWGLQRFAIDALRHLIEQPATTAVCWSSNFLRRPSASEFMFCCADPHGAYASLARAWRAGCTHAPVTGSKPATWCSPRSTSTAPTRAPRRLPAAGEALAAQFLLRRWR
jgi:hypothetical protein